MCKVKNNRISYFFALGVIHSGAKAYTNNLMGVMTGETLAEMDGPFVSFLLMTKVYLLLGRSNGVRPSC